jgi:hypothetical protein
MRKRYVKTTSAAAVALAVSSAAGVAHAQAFGSEGDVSFAAERLMGLYLYREEPADKVTAFGLFSPPSTHPYLEARLGFDVFVVRQLSIGAAFAYWSWDHARGGSPSGYLIEPRIGYAFQFGRSFGFWPRGGVTIRNVDHDDEVALTIEGLFWAAPATHFAFIFGPTLDVGVAGRGNEATSIGVLSAGILGWI